jgi:hypothetical protein
VWWFSLKWKEGALRLRNNGEPVHNIQIPRQKQCRKTDAHQSKTVQDEQHPQDARKESRSRHQDAEGEKPKAPKDVGEVGSVSV